MKLNAALAKGLSWARAHKRAVLAVTAVAAGVVAHYVPGVPREAVVNAVAALLGV
jgi:hypothetical protein